MSGRRRRPPQQPLCQVAALRRVDARPLQPQERPMEEAATRTGGFAKDDEHSEAVR